MSHCRVLLCRVDDPVSKQMTELATFEFPTADVSTLQPATAMDELETSTRETPNSSLRRVLQAQQDSIDAELTECHHQQASQQAMLDDAHESVTVASRFTQRLPALTLCSQPCSDPLVQSHVIWRQRRFAVLEAPAPEDARPIVTMAYKPRSRSGKRSMDCAHARSCR